jgi:hypothetical protein
MVSTVSKSRSAPSQGSPSSSRLNPALLLERAPWDSVSEDQLRSIPFDSPLENYADVSAEIIRGDAQNFRVSDAAGNRLGFLVVRVESLAFGRELVVIAAYLDSGKSGPLTSTVSALVDDLARAENCDSIRFHTARHSVARYMAEFQGYRMAEAIMRKDVE